MPPWTRHPGHRSGSPQIDENPIAGSFEGSGHDREIRTRRHVALSTWQNIPYSIPVNFFGPAPGSLQLDDTTAYLAGAGRRRRSCSE
jgi:hypothetical protein